jgi:hypothetical protein
MFINRSFKMVWSLMSMWGVAWLTCIQNERILRMLGKCWTQCHLEMSSLGPPWYWDMWTAAMAKRHWNSFNKCARKVCG